MTPPNLKFWSISRKEIPESQPNMQSEIGFGEHNCFQMTFLIPDTIGKR